MRDALEDGLAATSGLHSTSVDRLVDLWLRSLKPDAIDTWLAAMSSKSAVDVAGVVAPGNLFVATWTAVLEPWLRGCRVIVRPSTRDPVAPQNLANALGIIDSSFAGTIVDDLFDRRDTRSWARFFARVGAVAIYGSDEALDEIAAHAGPGSPPLRRHGHKVSIGYLSAQDWQSLATDPALCEAIAHDALLADGRGCMSLRALVVEGAPQRNADSLAALAAAVEVVARRLPAGTIATAITAGRRMSVEQARLDAAIGGNGVVIEFGDAWLVVDAVARPTIDTPALGPGSRVLQVLGGPSWRGLAAFLAPLTGHWSTLASVDGAHAAVFDRGCVFGAMQQPDVDRDPDGHAVGAVFDAR